MTIHNGFLYCSDLYLSVFCRQTCGSQYRIKLARSTEWMRYLPDTQYHPIALLYTPSLTVNRATRSAQTLTPNSTTMGQTLPSGPASKPFADDNCFDIQGHHLLYTVCVTQQKHIIILINCCFKYKYISVCIGLPNACFIDLRRKFSMRVS